MSDQAVSVEAINLKRVAIGLIILGVLIHLLGFLAFRVVAAPDLQTEPVQPFARFVFEYDINDPLLREVSALSDSEPLFIPTEWNAGIRIELSAMDTIDRSPFESFSAEITIGEGEGEILYQARPQIPSDPRAVLEHNIDAVFETFGRGRAVPVAPRPLGAEVEIRDFYSDQVRRRFGIALDGESDSWGYAEFIIQIQNGSLLGQPVLSTGTADEELDRTLAEALLNVLRDRELATGYYRVLIGI